MKEADQKKTTSEKPISLTPLDVSEALKALVQVKPKEKPKKKPRTKKQTKKPSS